MDDTRAGKSTVTARQRRAIELLLKVGSVTATAEALSVSRSCVHKWLKRPEVASALAEAEGDALATLSRRLVELGEKATVTLDSSMDGGAPAAVRVSAANSVLANLLKVRELAMLESRVATLEREILDREGKK